MGEEADFSHLCKTFSYLTTIWSTLISSPSHRFPLPMSFPCICSIWSRNSFYRECVLRHGFPQITVLRNVLPKPYLRHYHKIAPWTQLNPKCSKCISIQVKEILVGGVGFSPQTISNCLLLLGAKFSLRLTICFTRAVLNSGVENRNYVLAVSGAKRKPREFYVSASQAEVPACVLLSVLWEELRNPEM